MSRPGLPRSLRLPLRALPVLLAVGLALAGALAARVPTVRGATPDLTLVTAARYQVIPDQQRLTISVAITATNRLKDTITRQYYFDRAYLAVMPGTSNFKVTSPSGTPKVAIQSKQSTYWVLRIDFPSRLAAGKSMTLQLSMDLKDPGGSPTRSVRVGTNLVSFPIWAYGTGETPGSTVTVSFPADYEVSFDAGELAGPATEADGRRAWTSGTIQDALAYYAYVVADRPGAYAETSKTVPLGDRQAKLIVRAWPDDPDWAKRVGGLFERGLPVLAEEIGLPWPRTEPLVVQEAISRNSGGYAGLFDPEAGKVEVAYYAGSLVVLHEAAHAWFNGSLLADRWANEAFASWYALAAAAALNEKVTPDELTPELQANAIPLNAWGAVGSTPPANEDYAYAASLQLARLIAERAGPDGLSAVWAAAASNVAAYQPTAGPLERNVGPPDWRGLLDLLEASGTSYTDLWQDWVARPEDAPLLDARAGARVEYESIVKVAGDWQLPRSIRDAMRAWQFEAATSQLEAARAILEQRTAIIGESAALETTPPTTLRTLFQRNGSLDDAMGEAAAERTALAAIRSASASRPAQPDLAQTVGLWGADPDADLAAARGAFATGSLDDAEAAAGQARLLWLSAEDYGRTRLTSAALLALAVAIAVVIVLRRRRRTVAEPVDGSVNGSVRARTGPLSFRRRSRGSTRMARPVRPPASGTDRDTG